MVDFCDDSENMRKTKLEAGSFSGGISSPVEPRLRDLHLISRCRTSE
jgi:hypothetical protein